MPIVPRVTERQVGTAPLPGVRLDGNVPASAFGVPAAPDLSGVQRVVAGIVQEETQKADELAVLDADAQLGRLENQLLHDPETGALARRGKDAFGLPESVRTTWEQGVADREVRLTSDRQRLAFRRLAAQRGVSVERTVQRHVAGEIDRYDTETTEAHLATERDAAIANAHDPERVALAVAKTRAVLTDHGRRTGKPAEWLTLKTAEAVSQVHAGVVGRLLANGEDRAASAYYATNKAEVTGADATQIERALEEGSLRGEAQRQTDAIVAQHQTLEGALGAARELGDPKVRDEVVRRVKERWSERRAAERDRQEQDYLAATNAIDNAPGRRARDVVSPALWSRLSLEMRNALERRADEPSDNDDRAWLTFLALTPQAIAGLSRSEFESRYWTKFDRAHRGRAESLWLQAREGATRTGGSPELTAALTVKDRVDNTMRATGIIPADRTPSQLSRAQAATAARFETEAARRIEHYELTALGGKRKATGTEIQTILDEMAINISFDRGLFRRDAEVPAALVTDEERGVAYVPYGQIPAAERNDLENRLRAKGRRITEDKVQRAYAAVVLGDAAGVAAILEER